MTEEFSLETETTLSVPVASGLVEPGSHMADILGEMRELGMHTEADRVLHYLAESRDYVPSRSQKIRNRIAFALVSMQILAASGIALLGGILMASDGMSPSVNAENTGATCTDEVPALIHNSLDTHDPLQINAADTHALPSEPIPELEEQLARSTVQIESSDSLGTGFVMQNAAGQNIIITAGHVIEGNSAEDITVITNEGQELSANAACTIIADNDRFLSGSDTDIDWDIGLVATGVPINVPPLVLTDEPVQRGESVYTVNYGFPYGFDVGRLGYSTLVTGNDGINIDMIAGLSPHSDVEDTLVASGASGGAITDSNGEVEGVLVTSLNEDLYLGSDNLVNEYGLRITGVTVGNEENSVRPSDAHAMTTNQIAPLLFVDIDKIEE